jgi:uncharacterized protein
MIAGVAYADGALTLQVKVVPRASRSEILSGEEGMLRLRITSPPVDGAANEEIVRFFSRLFGVSKSEVEIVSGQTSRSKRIRISGVDADAIGILESAVQKS